MDNLEIEELISNINFDKSDYNWNKIEPDNPDQTEKLTSQIQTFLVRNLSRSWGSSTPDLVLFCCLEPVWASQCRISAEKTVSLGCDSAR